MSTTHYLWDAASEQLLAELDDDLQPTRVYTHAPRRSGSLISSRHSASTEYFQFDATHSTRQLTDAAGVPGDPLHFSAFGVLLGNPASVPGFAYVGELGYQRLQQIDAYLVGRSSYGPAQGRWMNQASRLQRGQANPFTYVDNRPVDRFRLPVDDGEPGWPASIPFEGLINQLVDRFTQWLRETDGHCACEVSVAGVASWIDYWFIENTQDRPNWPWQHCTTNCLMVSVCGPSAKSFRCAAQLNLLKEVMDLIYCIRDGCTGRFCDSAFQLTDLYDNQMGRLFGLFYCGFQPCFLDHLECCAKLCHLQAPIGVGEGRGQPRRPHGVLGEAPGPSPALDLVLSGTGWERFGPLLRLVLHWLPSFCDNQRIGDVIDLENKAF